MSPAAVAGLDGLPSWAGAAHGRNVLSVLVGTARRLRVVGVHQVPRQGPVLLVPTVGGIAAGLLLQAAAPRPVHVIAPAAAWVPPWDRLLATAGWLPLDLTGPDRRALRRGVQALLAGRALALPADVPGGQVADVRVPPQAAYLVAHTQAAVVPVLLPRAEPAPAARPTGRRPRRAVQDVVFGPPVRVEATDQPHRRAVLARISEQVRQGVADALATAAARTQPWTPSRGANTWTA